MWLRYEASIHIAIFILTVVFNFVELVFGRCTQRRSNLFRMLWAMPSARATPGSLRSVFALQRTKPCVSLSRLFYLELCFLRGISELFELLGRCLRPGLLRARYRSVAFGELYPSHPYRNFVFILKYVLGGVF